MIRKPFTKLNDAAQSRLQFLAEKFNTSITKVAFVSLFISIYSVFFLELIYIFIIDRGASPQISALIFATLSILIVKPSLIYRRFGELAKHDKKIRELQQKYNKFKRLPITGTRVFGVAFFSILSIALLWLIYKNPYEWVILDTITRDTKSIISLSTLIITTPIAFIVWVFRDKNKLLELENARKDTNLKEFQQLQRWATGNIDGNNKGNKVVLQISALHSLCAYLKGEYGESFRRGAYEIFRATLATQHQKILTQVRNNKFENIANAIDDCQLTKQLNVIASEEWFNLLINHNFPTKGISLVGVDLSRTYLHHRTYSKTLDLREAQLQGANLQSAQLQGVNLFNAQLQGANLQRTQLQGANLQGTQLQGANLQSAQLQGVILIDAQLQEVILIDAQLQGVNLFNAQLQGANLENTQLQGAYVKKYEWKNFEQRIKRQINKKTDIQNLEKQCEELGDANKLDFPESKASSGISHIESASEMLDLSKAITGKYSRKEANKWINNYKNVKKNDF
ncbi:pentapeptide repeat-containing protein [Bathymodiolus thermophilus thioautotrophic gill symbiont]|nr:pentapeptide repeat-containing protein [Bathymodiolus thermophilus thioautotrophic gill symbiont]